MMASQTWASCDNGGEYSWNELAAWLLSNHTSPKLPTCPRARLEAQRHRMYSSYGTRYDDNVTCISVTDSSHSALSRRGVRHVSGSLGVLLGSASPPKPAPKSRKRGRRIADERCPMSWTGRCSLLPSPAAEPWPGARCAPPGGRSAPSTGRVSRQPPALGYAPFLPPSGLSPGRRGQDLWRPASSSSGRVIGPATTETGLCP